MKEEKVLEDVILMYFMVLKVIVICVVLGYEEKKKNEMYKVGDGR